MGSQLRKWGSFISANALSTKGNNSATNQEILDASHFHFVGSLVPTHFADLLALPVEKFQELEDARLKPIKDQGDGPAMAGQNLVPLGEFLQGLGKGDAVMLIARIDLPQ